LSHLLSVLHQLSGSTIDGASYTVDSAGNRTAKTDHLANVTTGYGYDSIYQLLQATQGGTTKESYTYDPVGNRLSSLGVSSYTNNSSNELTSTSNASFTYDYDGNTTSKTDSAGTTSYTWDVENRLTQVTLPGSAGTVNFKYDPFGRRIEKISPNATSIFVYDGDDLVETVSATGSAVARYTQGQNIDEPLAMQRGTTTEYYEQDGLGSITSLSGSTGTIGQSYTYDSFGNTTNSSGSLTNFSRYTGREFDTETNLYFYRARYYDPSTGRFISEDPIGFGGGDANLYAYVQNESTSLADPLGLSPSCSGTHTCVGRARVLAGNPKTLGQQGGVPGKAVAPNSAAATPKQWGFATGAGFSNLPVSGTTGAPIPGPLASFFFGDVNSSPNGVQQNFNGITDVNGGKSPIAGMNVRDALMQVYPGTLIIELVNGQDQGVTTVILTLPQGIPCPSGTLDSKALQIHTTPFGR
jgi:RHS repeat-associated protein